MKEENQETQKEVSEMVENFKINAQNIHQDIHEYMKNFKCETCDQMAMAGKKICVFCWVNKRRSWHKPLFWQYALTFLGFCPLNIMVGSHWGTKVQFVSTGFFIGGLIISCISNGIAEILDARRN